MEPLNNGHIRGVNLILCWEVVPISEVALKIVYIVYYTSFMYIINNNCDFQSTGELLRVNS